MDVEESIVVQRWRRGSRNLRVEGAEEAIADKAVADSCDMVDEGWTGFARSRPDTGVVVTESEAGIHCSGVFGCLLYLGTAGTSVIPRRSCRVEGAVEEVGVCGSV